MLLSKFEDCVCPISQAETRKQIRQQTPRFEDEFASIAEELRDTRSPHKLSWLGRRRRDGGELQVPAPPIAKRGASFLSPRKPNSRKKNSRRISSSSNTKTMSTPQDSSSSTTPLSYKGVRMRSWGKWVSEIREPNKRTRIWLGSFPTAEMAAKAYDAAVICLRGSSATLNFPNPPPSNLPRCSTPRDVQAAAAAAAATCRTIPKAASRSSPPTKSVDDNDDKESATEVYNDAMNPDTMDHDTVDPKNNALENWIDAEFGCLEPLEETHCFPEPEVRVNGDHSLDYVEYSPPVDGNLWSFS